MRTEPRRRPPGKEWRSGLLHAVAGLLIFETLSGLSIWLLPFNVPNQVMVLLHTVLGLVFLVPFAWYQARHLAAYRRMRVSHVVLTGYFAMTAVLVAIVTGLVLTGQALFGRRIGYGWDLAHILATVAVVLSIVPHVAVLLWRGWRNGRAAKPGRLAVVRAGQRRFVAGTLGISGVAFLGVAAASLAYRPPELNDEFPPDYGHLYGEDRPFAPSLATTSTGGAFDSRTLAGSAACGSSGCHEEIYAEWEVSAHRWSAMDPAFQEVQSVMAEQNGPESTRYCGGCHDPISLFSGAKMVFTDELTNQAGYQEGVSCVACHGIEETDVQGNADYVMSRPDRYLLELRGGELAKRVSDFLIRAYPRHHVASLQHTLFKSPEFCAACHKQFIDEEINQVGWVQLQNQYDNWRKSRWNHPGDPSRTIECRECHMPLVPSADPAAGDALDYNRSPHDGRHRSHRFLGANQFIPAALDLPGAEEQVELTRKWLRGEIEVPEIAHKWREGPAVPIEILAPASVRAGSEVTLQVAITNNKVGHDFPTGPLDIIQAWVELLVTDSRGNVVFESGRRDEDHFIEPGSFLFKAEPVDRYGNLIDRHNLWEMVGVRYRRSLFPGFSDRAEFRLIPGVGPDELRVRARLMYRKSDQFLLNFLFGEASGVTAPVTVMSEDEARIRVVRAAAP